ncbi:MAG: hypothetical protein R2851_09415 [Caldilineaceae bacterium]
MSWNSPILIKPAAATSTSDPKVACGIKLISGASNSSVNATTPAVTMAATCRRRRR